MIPGAADVIAAFNWLAKRRGWSGAPNRAAVADAVMEARSLAVDERDEPAAIFFALARRPRGIGEAWPVLPSLLARNVAAAQGAELHASEEELARLRVAIVVQRRTFEEIRRWFAERR